MAVTTAAPVNTGPKGDSGNIELGYVESGAAGQATGANSNVAANIVPLVATVLVGVRPIKITVQGQIQGAQASIQCFISLWEDGVQIAEWNTLTTSVAFGFVPFHRSKRRAPAAGEHTYQVKIRSGAINQTVSLSPTNDVISLSVEEG